MPDAYGHVRERCDLIVSGGLGCSILPFRLGRPPEVVVVTLRGDDAATPKDSIVGELDRARG